MTENTTGTKKMSRLLLLASTALLLSACASGDRTAPPTEPASHYKVGQPYQINGIWYYPKEDYSYDETGIASWYGAEFEGRARTSNGEIFNRNELTAAHKTLQLPCLARVTNMDNGKSIVVRVNDRGPFSGARLIDVSQRAAQLLGFDKKGTAKVRVQVLADESKAIADALRHYGTPTTAPQIADTAPPMQTAPIGAVTAESLAPPVHTAAAASAPAQVAAAGTLGALSAGASAAPAQPQVKWTLQNVKPVPQALQLAVSGSNQIYIQAGAFNSLENAKKLQQSLTGFGRTLISETTVKGAKFYRVRVGPVPDVPQADKLLDKITKSGVQGARTVVE